MNERLDYSAPKAEVLVVQAEGALMKESNTGGTESGSAINGPSWGN